MTATTLLRTLRTRQAQRGFAMQDLMLSLAIVGVMTVAAIPLMVKNTDEVKAKETADDWSTFNGIASAHFLANRDAYMAAMKDGTNADKLCRVGADPATGTGGVQSNDTTLHTCAIDGTMYKYFKVLPDNIKSTNRYGESWVAIFRQVYDAGAPPVPTGGVELIIVSANTSPGVLAGGAAPAVAADPRRYEEITSSATYAGGSGGVIPDSNRSTCVASRAASNGTRADGTYGALPNNTFQACGNGWRANLSDFISPAQLATFSNRLPG